MKELDARTTKELESLLAALREETIDAAQAARLEELVCQHEAARELYVESMNLHALMRWRFTHESQDAAVELAASAGGQRFGRFWAWSKTFWNHPTPQSISVAVTVLGIIVVSLALITPPVYRTITRTNAPSNPEFVARLTATHRAKWVETQVGATRGSHLVAGQRMQLQAGLSEITFNNGVTGIIEGPALFQIHALGEMSLESGRATFTVPEAGRGFKVVTPTAEVVDLGTQFGIDASAAGQTDVAVYQGVITLAARADLGNVKPLRLVAGQRAQVVSGKVKFELAQTGDSPSRPLVREFPKPTIQAVRSSTGNRFLIDRQGLNEDSRAYSDEIHQWNGIDSAGLPKELLGLEYVRTANADRFSVDATVYLTLARPADVYLLIGSEGDSDAWVQRDFVKTDLRVGLDAIAGRGWPKTPGKGPGESIDIVFEVWKRRCEASEEIVLGPRKPRTAMFGIVVQPLE